MSRLCLPVVLALVTLTARAEPPAPVYMTGASLLQLLTIPPESVGQLTSAQASDLNRAHQYMAGVHDATSGKQWCDNLPHYPKPDVVYWVGKEGLQALPPPALQRNAAHLLVDIWRRRWPCKGAAS